MIDSPSILPTDIMHIVNYLRGRSFTKIQNNKMAITTRGWGPLSYNLLTNSQIQPVRTKSESILLCTILKVQSDSSSVKQQSSAHDTSVIINSTSLSKLTDDLEMNYITQF